MTEVIRSNYELLLPEILELILQADFVAIDSNVETTGFITIDEKINPEVVNYKKGWYKFLVDNQTTRSPLDLGIAVFKKKVSSSPNTSSVQYYVNCYSIPVFVAYVEEHDARSNRRRAKDSEQRLEIHSSGMEFIRRTMFDLNKVFYAGVPFMNRQVAEEAEDYMRQHPDFMTIKGQHVTNGKLDRHYFPNIIDKVEEEDIREIITRLRGVCKIFDVIAENKIPVVGHNLLLKLVFMYKDFMEYLPSNLVPFLQNLGTFLPLFYDTKYIAEELAQAGKLTDVRKAKLQNTGLFTLYRKVDWVGKDKVEFQLDNGSAAIYQLDLDDLLTEEELEFKSDTYCHESGFDACLSGIIFVRLASLIRGKGDAEGSMSLDKAFFEKESEVWKNNAFVDDELKVTLEQLFNGSASI